MQIETEQLEELQREDTPTGEIATEETPVEEIATEETPVEEIATEEAPIEEIASEETLTEETAPEEMPDVPEPPQPVKKFYKSPKFWTALIGGLTCLCVLIVIMAALREPREEPESTVPPTTQAIPTESTEATLPPPEANPIGLGDFAMMGNYLTCITTKSVLGIDVSEWQENINWQAVKDAGVEFAMIRVGWRGSEQGVLVEDTCAQANYAGASAVGIKVGAYFFSQAINTAEAVEEANYLISLIQDWNVEMPVVFDWEYINEDSRTGKMDPRTLTDCTKAFCDAVAAAGYEPMIYFNISHSYDNIYIRELTDYKFWLARYDTVLNYPYKINMWQYTETGSVPGISTNVDINLFFPWEE